jgi:arginase family enzyme
VRELFDAGFMPGVRAPMCVGLTNPEMRTLITLEADETSLPAEVAKVSKDAAGE